ncbi:DUF4148 domain-containing protein [Azohydromonas australica]|uniref:DUF4148 domain-containing protein n=1 Tax=Azohydromonas australica TaxID=364039 RepID=UPI0012EB3AF1|nr:DUF4148 domain-containing protein [Azohydromonas australica]
MKLYLVTAAFTAVVTSTSVWALDRPLARAAVKAELGHARADGSLDRIDNDSYGGRGTGTDESGTAAGAAGRGFATAAPSMQRGKTRAEVKEELRQARYSGELRRVEDSEGPGD